MESAALLTLLAIVPLRVYLAFCVWVCVPDSSRACSLPVPAYDNVPDLSLASLSLSVSLIGVASVVWRASGSGALPGLTGARTTANSTQDTVGQVGGI
jgi:hypothetical protein